MNESAPDSAQLRRWIYHLVIAIAFAVACGRIVSAQRVYEPAFHKDLAKQIDRRPLWPKSRPDAMPMFGSNDRSRWATVRALVHDGSYVIGRRDATHSAVALLMANDPIQGVVLAQAGLDQRTDVSNKLSHHGVIFKEGEKEHGWATIDRVLKPDTLEFYSSKPPLLATILAGIYWVIYHVFGLSLIANPTTVVRAMLLVVNALPFAGYLWLLTQFAERWGKTDWGKLYVVAAGAFATMVSPFMITLQNHTFGAFSVMLAWWSVLCVWDRISLPSLPGRGVGGEGAAASSAGEFAAGTSPSPPAPLPLSTGAEGRTAPWPHFVSAGFFAAFAVTCELPALSFAVAVLALLVWWCPRQALLFALPAALVPMIGYFATNYAAIGQLLPIQAEFGNNPWYEYEGSHWMPPPEGQKKFGIDWARYHESRAQYALHVLVGHHGVFSLSPIWLLAVAGMLAGCWHWRKLWVEALCRERGEFPWFVQPLGLALTVVVISFYLYKSTNYGGFTNGLRWLMWLTPIWLTCLMPMADRLATSKTGRWIGGILLAISVFSVSYQLWSPWRHPWIFDLMVECGWSAYLN